MGPAIFIPMAIGAVVNTGVAIAKGKPFGEVLTSGLTGAALGAATGGIGSLVSGGLAGGTAVAGEVGKAALTEGASQAAQQGVGSSLVNASTGLATDAAKEAVTQGATGLGQATSFVPSASDALSAISKPNLMQDLATISTQSTPVAPANLTANTMGNIASDAYPSLMGTAQTPYSKVSLLDSATSGIKDLQPAHIAPTEAPTTTIKLAQPTTAERYAKALEESNKLNKTKTYIEGAKTVVDTAQAATAKEPQPSLRPMGYPQPVQLTGGNTDLMAQLMALAGGR